MPPLCFCHTSSERDIKTPLGPTSRFSNVASQPNRPNASRHDLYGEERRLKPVHIHRRHRPFTSSTRNVPRITNCFVTSLARTMLRLGKIPRLQTIVSPIQRRTWPKPSEKVRDIFFFLVKFFGIILASALPRFNNNIVFTHNTQHTTHTHTHTQNAWQTFLFYFNAAEHTHTSNHAHTKQTNGPNFTHLIHVGGCLGHSCASR